MTKELNLIILFCLFCKNFQNTYSMDFEINSSVDSNSGVNCEILSLKYLAIQKFTRDLYHKHSGDKLAIEKEVRERLTSRAANKLRLIPELAVEIAKQYYYEYGFEKIEEGSRQSAFLNIGIQYGFSIKDLFLHGKVPSCITEPHNSSNFHLDLSFLKINSLRGLSLITNARQINSLDLSHNQIEFIEDEAFTNLLSLYDLDLSHNNIKLMSFKAFKGIPGLSKLDLSNNKITQFHVNMFKKLRLGWLNLKNNNIQDISSFGFEELDLWATIVCTGKVFTLKPLKNRSFSNSTLVINLTGNPLI